MKKVTLALLFTAALLTACGKSGGGAAEHSEHAGHGEMSGMEHGGSSPSQVNAQSAGVQAAFKLSADQPQPKQDVTMTIQLQDASGKPITKLDTVHEKLLHLIIVSKDLSFFNHVHPENKGNGQFTITTAFPAAGEYKAIADFSPTGMGAMNKSQWFTVQGQTAAVKPLEPEKQLMKTVDGKRVTLSLDRLAAGKELTMNFRIEDANSGQPIKNLQPYLGAVGHVVILSQDASDYLHVHPTEEKASGPDAKFMTTFPRSGVYKIWGQFQHEGKVFTVPFVVQVP